MNECGTHAPMTRLYARAPRGERAYYGKAPRNRGKNTTPVASMTAEGMGPCAAVEGATTEAVFEAYVEQVLEPSLRAGRVVILDNLGGARRGEGAREMVEARGCEVVYLPPSYSPDSSPIEEASSKIKALLGKAAARTREALVEAMGARGGDGEGRPRLVRPLRVRGPGSTPMNTTARTR